MWRYVSVRKATSNQLNHFKSKHPASETASDSMIQPSVSMFMSLCQRKMSSSESEKITCAIADMVVKDYVPLSVVDGQGFNKLMSTVAPEYKVPSLNTVRTRIIKRYDGEKEALINHLKSVSSAPITTDTWTSNSTESYITVTEHHINNDWKMEANVLLTRAIPETYG